MLPHFGKKYSVCPSDSEIKIWSLSFKMGENTFFKGASLVSQKVKNLPAMQETWVRSVGGEDPLEKEMATHTSILAWRIPWTEEPDEL